MTTHETPAGVSEERRAALRKFALVTGAMIGVMFGLVLPWLFSIGRWPWMPWVIGGTLALFGLVAPQLLDVPERYWMKGAAKVGHFNSLLLLSVVYWLVLTPTGLLMRALGKDPMDRKLNPEATTYRITSDPRRPGHMNDPF